MSSSMDILRLGLAEAIAHWRASSPDRPAIVSGARVVSWRQLDQEVQDVADHLVGLGETRQRPIGVLATSPIQSIRLCAGVLRMGGQVVLLNPWLPLASLEAAVADAGCRSVLAEDLPEDLEDASTRGAFPGCQVVQTREIDRTRGSARFTGACSRAGDWIWGILYSSGTTGIPKGVLHTDMSMLMELISWTLELPLTRDTVVYVGRPLCYTAGLVISMSTLLVGSTLVAPKVHTPEVYWRLCEERAIDLALFIPDQVRELVDAASASGRPTDAPRARTILSMGSTLPIATKLAAPKALGSQLIEAWGNSEGLGTITTPEDLAVRPRSIGRPFLSDLVTILDEEGNELPPGVIGRVAGTADCQFLRYSNRDDLNRTMIKNGLTISEDLGYRDEDGYFYIAGRAVERLMRRGCPIYATDIEGILIEVPGVQAATVVGVPDARDGQVPVAAVVLRPDCAKTEAAVLAEANQRLADVQKLTAVKVVAELKHNAAGKVILESVRSLFSAEPSS